MSSFLRGEVMELVQIIIPKEASYECIGELGIIGNVQFNDLNSTKNILKRYFIRDTKRCEDIVRRLNFLRGQIQDCIPKIIMTPFSHHDITVPPLNEINILDTKLDELERDLDLMNENGKTMRRNYNEMNEYKHVLERVEQFFEVHVQEQALHEIETAEYDAQETFSKSYGSGSYPANGVPLTPLLDPALESNENTWFITGVLPVDKRNAFEILLWRACRRTAFVRISDVVFEMDDPETQDKIKKVVFITFFKGDSLRNIIEKVCYCFNARVYPCPKTSKERQDTLIDVIAALEDHKIILDSTLKERHQILSIISKDLPHWTQKVQIHKAIYHALNMCTVDTNGFLLAECWLPAQDRQAVHDALQEGIKKSGSNVSPVMNVVETAAVPPTYNRTNKFTEVFQSIVDSYGIANYQEVNPAPFIIITFPFLFGVMFGDAAHGLILFLAGFLFIYNEKTIIEKRIRDEIFNMFFGGRYIILLMGLFSMYTGFMYNDFLGKSINLFDSRWLNPYNETDLLSPNAKGDDFWMLDPKDSYQAKRGPYPYGVDPIWNIAENRLSFTNSMKMKMSVIIGVVQMTFGVLLSLLNHVHFKSKIDILTSFIPQLIFLSCIFIYLCVQIVIKWLFFTAGPSTIFGKEYPGSHCAPSLLIGLINTFMFKKRPEGWIRRRDGTQYRNCHLSQWYPGQARIEAVLIGLSLSCIPIMLFGKPLAAWLGSKKKKIVSDGEDHALLENGKILTHIQEDHGDIGEIFVHQAIHSIEFVLGCVSHTASYLRLWALSLAHAQLAEVLWHMVLMTGMSAFENHIILGPLITVFVFCIYAILTLGILVMMEGLSAFLHALRLHWVEFQSKFYMGTGNPFRPYSLLDASKVAEAQILSTDDV